MRQFFALSLFLMVLVAASSAAAGGGRLFVDDDGVCEGHTPCYTHPQAAVNAANPGDTIEVYPGIYSNPTDLDPNSNVCQDDNAPTVIVYKASITLRAVEGAQHTTIEATQPCWSNPSAIETWTNGALSSSASPNAVAIAANDVTVHGFTIRSTYAGDPNAPGDRPNTAGVFIGGLYAGDNATSPGIGSALIKRNVISGWSAVRVNSSSNNEILSNYLRTIDPLEGTPRGSNILGYDWGVHPVTGLVIEKNSIDATHAAQGIAVGSYDVPPQPRQMTISKNLIWGALENGIFIYNSDFSDSVIEKNDIDVSKDSTDNDAIQLQGGRGEHVVIDHNRLTAGGLGINAFGAVLIESHIGHNNMPDVLAGVYLGGGTSEPVIGNEITHNRIIADHPTQTIRLQTNTVENYVIRNILRAETQRGNDTVNDNGMDNVIEQNQ